jgi:hypothetical protein
MRPATRTMRHAMAERAVAGFLALILTCTCSALDFPGPAPGAARAASDGKNWTLENDVIACGWSVIDGAIRPVSLRNKISGVTLELAGTSECFEVVLTGGRRIRASEMTMVDKPAVEALEAEPGCSNLARRSPGKQITARLRSRDGRLEVAWRAVLRDGSSYVRQVVELKSLAAEVPLDTLALVDLALPREPVALIGGHVPGSPVVAGDFFFAYEHANSDCAIPPALPSLGQQVTCRLKRDAAIQRDRPTVQSSAYGVTPPGQMRRGFLYYVERERAHPYRPALHYNSWYDVSWPGHRMNEAECMAVIDVFGRELTAKRGVRLQCYLWDDGWDEIGSLWRIDPKGFPRGFAPMLAAARKQGSALGVWIGPWGGYGSARKKRIEAGEKEGFEVVDGVFSMAGPNYYRRFLETSLYWIKEIGCVHFKYDGMSAARIEEAEAMVRIIAELRKVEPDLFVNLTTGTWPSPFYLWHGDSTWRGGFDMGFVGAGSKRQQWITYRDLETYRGVVLKSPLYPINSLMTQGIVHARFGPAGRMPMDAKEFRDEVRSFFASGTCTQELYITPQKLSQENWDDLAEAARWAHARADVLVDVHWIGGHPGKGEVYGWAAWTPKKAMLALRNPSDRAARFAVDVGKVFELPKGATERYYLRSPWRSDARREPVEMVAGTPKTVELAPFEVIVFDALPSR